MPSAFIQFSNAKREEVKQANPDADFGKLGKLLGEMWRALSEEEKAKYASTASVKKASKKASVKAKPEEKPAQEGEEEEEDKSEEKKSAAAEEKPAAAEEEKEKVEEDDKPKKASKKATKKKRPVSAYIQFCNANRDKVKASNPKATFGELGKLLGQMWRQQKKTSKTVSKR